MAKTIYLQFILEIGLNNPLNLPLLAIRQPLKVTGAAKRAVVRCNSHPLIEFQICAPPAQIWLRLEQTG